MPKKLKIQKKKKKIATPSSGKKMLGKALTKLNAPVTKTTKKPQLSQRDTYAKAMYGATKKGGSNGIGVGY